LNLHFRSQADLPFSVLPCSFKVTPQWCRNINLLSIAYAFRPQLRVRLTLGGLPFPRKPWASGVLVSHQHYRLLISTYSLASFSIPYPSEIYLNLFPPNPFSSAKLITSVNGSAPGLNIKTIGDTSLLYS